MSEIDHGPTEHGGYILRFQGGETFWLTGVIRLAMSDEAVIEYCATRFDNMIRRHVISEENAVVGLHHIMNYVHGRDAEADQAEDPGPEVVE